VNLPQLDLGPDDAPRAARPPGVGTPGGAVATEQWRELMTQLGSEISGPLTAALERIVTLTTSGQIDRHSLRALRDEVEAARRAGMIGQQLARFASGRIRQSHESVDLTHLLKDVLLQRGRDLQSRGLPLRQVLKEAQVVADASLVFAMLNGLIDWCTEHAKSTIDLRIDHTQWPVHARITCRFAYRVAGDLLPDAPPSSLNTLAWRLVQHSAKAMGLEVERDEIGIETVAEIRFPRTVEGDIGDAPAIPVPEAAHISSFNSKPLAGSHVLVVASRRDLRLQVREAVEAMGLILDFVPSVDEARAFCENGVPHAVVYESVLGGERLDELREDLRREIPGLPFIEIIEEGDVFKISAHDPKAVARVGRWGLKQALPSALNFELSKNL
jgi:uncharacterized protein with HEPN domain